MLGHVLVLATKGAVIRLGFESPRLRFIWKDVFMARAKPKLKLHQPKATVTKRDVTRRWTEKLAKGGWTPVVQVFLEHYASLSPPITTPEAIFIIHLMSFKWDEKMPWPAFKTLAKRMGVSTTAVRNHARSLDVGKKYLVRHPRVGQPNLFDLKPLFVALEKAQAAAEARKRKEGKPLRAAGA